jgi:hypothetical protein
MTDEQIKQNAQEWCIGLHELVQNKSACEESYIAGAQSRDEEIKELEERIKVLDMNLVEQQLENQQLHNPWISVEDRLPEKLENDCVSYYVLTRIDGPRQIWYMVNRYNYDIKSWEGCNNNTTHWMPIPELKKGNIR